MRPSAEIARNALKENNLFGMSWILVVAGGKGLTTQGDPAGNTRLGSGVIPGLKNETRWHRARAATNSRNQGRGWLGECGSLMSPPVLPLVRIEIRTLSEFCH